MPIRKKILESCIAIFMCVCSILNCFSQNIGINTTGVLPADAAMLDIVSTNRGVLIPRVSLTDVALYAPLTGTPATSLLVYSNTSPTGGGGMGYYYWDGAKWVSLSGGSGGKDWSLLGNAGTVDGTNFIGTTDNIPFNIRANNQKAARIETNVATGNTFFGYQAGNANSGNSNTGTGYLALTSNTSGDWNTANGYLALTSNITGNSNTAIGRHALRLNTSGYNNTAAGDVALYSNTTGFNNTAIGNGALHDNTTGGWNTAIGNNALYSNAGGTRATAIGFYAMFYANDQAAAFTNSNVAVGYEALRGSTTASANTGNSNTAIGYQTLWSTTTGGSNTANGYQVLYNNSTGSNNTAMGYQAGYGVVANSYSNNSLFGYQAGYGLTTGSHNTAVGYQALYSNTAGNTNVATGYQALYSTTVSNNTAYGVNALKNNSAGGDNTAIGVNAGDGTAGVDFGSCVFIGARSSPTVARNNVTMLGYSITNGQCTGNDQVCIGNTSIGAAGLRAAVTGWTAYSDARFKTNIKEDVAGLDFILKLKPVTYNVRPTELHKIWGTPDSVVNKIDHRQSEKETRIGFLAQDVEKAAKESGFNFPGIDVPGNDKEVYTLRYVDFIMPMVKAMQEQQIIIDELKSENQNLRLRIEKLESRSKQE